MTEEEKRIYVDAYECAKKNIEYAECIDKIIKLGHKIMKLLDNHRLLFLEYVQLTGLSESIYLKSVYHIGLEDGQKLHTHDKTMSIVKETVVI